MKCIMNKKKNLQILLAVGLLLLTAGVACLLLFGDTAGPTAMRLFGFITGAGGSIALVCGGWLLWKRIAGEVRANDQEREMDDERGQLILLKSAMVGYVVAALVVIGITLTALVRGDELYMLLGTVGCLLIAAGRFLSKRVFAKQM